MARTKGSKNRTKEVFLVEGSARCSPSAGAESGGETTGEDRCFSGRYCKGGREP